MSLTAHHLAELRERDPARYFAAFFVREPARGHLWALHAFTSEIATLADRVHDPAAGELRLQWWREAILSGDGFGNPLATAMLETIAANRLPLAPLERLLDAHIADFYADVPADITTFEAYAADTEGVALQLGAIVLGGDGSSSAEAAGHASVALALTKRLARLGRYVRSGRLFLPADRLAALGVDPAQPMAGERGDFRGILRDFRALALERLATAEAAVRRLSEGILPAFLPIATVRPALRRIARLRDPLADAGPLPQWRVQWAIWRAAPR